MSLLEMPSLTAYLVSQPCHLLTPYSAILVLWHLVLLRHYFQSSPLKCMLCKGRAQVWVAALHSDKYNDEIKAQCY